MAINYDLLTESNRALVTYVLNHYSNMQSEQSRIGDTFAQGLRTAQITEFTNLVAAYAEANPSEEPTPVDSLPELPATPQAWNSSHIVTAVAYFYGASYTISDAHAGEVVSYIIAQYNQTNELITWAKVQEALQILIAQSVIAIVLR